MCPAGSALLLIPFITSRNGTAWLALPWADVSPYLRHLLVPVLVARRPGRRRCDEVIAQSQTTTGRLRQAFGSRAAVHAIPPGIDLAAWPWHSVAGDDACRATALPGAATAIRGFDVTLDALSQVRDDRVRLRVLARGADADAVAAIHTAVARRGLAGVSRSEGGLDRPRATD